MMIYNQNSFRDDVELQPLEVQHAPAMYRWMCDPQVSRNIGLRNDPSLEKSIKWVEDSLQNQAVSPFAILIDERHVGNVVLDCMDNYLQSARFSIYIGESDLRGSGVGTTATHLCLSRGFTDLNLRKIWLTVHSKNFPAINTYSKMGFTLEGVLREEFLLDDERLSVFYMGMLKSDFDKTFGDSATI